jgi:uncharacterized protein YeaO (DUF488 family)
MDQQAFHLAAHVLCRYYWGNGVPKSRFQAAAWYRKAAEQDHAASQYELARMYKYDASHFDEGVAKNLAEAAFWFRKAANLAPQISGRPLCGSPQRWLPLAR